MFVCFTVDFKNNQEINERNRLNSKLPHILHKQKKLEEFDKAERVRIANQDKVGCPIQSSIK